MLSQLSSISTTFNQLIASGAGVEQLASKISMLSASQQMIILNNAVISPQLKEQIALQNGLAISEGTTTATTYGLATAQAILSQSFNWVITGIKKIIINLKALALANPAVTVIATAIAALIALYQHLRHEQEKQAQKQKELREEHEKQYNAYKEESQTLDSLIDRYSKYSEVTNLTEEDKADLLSIQEQLSDSFGGEAKGIDLVNGKYSEQLALLKNLSNKKKQDLYDSLTFMREDATVDYNNNRANSIFTSNMEDIQVDSITEKVWEAWSKIAGLSFVNGSPILPENLTSAEKVDTIDQMIKALRENTDSNDKRTEYYGQLINRLNQLREDYQAEVDAYNNTTSQQAQLAIEMFSLDGVDYQNVTKDIYPQWSEALIDSIPEDDTRLRLAVREKLKTLFDWQEDIETIVPEFSFSSWFEANDIEEVEKQINELKDIVKSVYDGNDLSGEQRALLSDLGLDGMIDDADKLADSVDKLTHEQLNDLSAELLELLKNAKSLDEHNAILGAMQYIDSLSQSASEVKDIYKAQTEELKKQIKTTQANINNAKQRKEAEEQVLESLKKQKEVLENQIDQYEKAAQAVQDYIDDQIDSLNKQKSAIEETYNKQIEALQDEADERERLNDLREKELALENAKNSKVRTYSAGGFAIVQDNSAIKQAQADYDKALNDSRIAQLEKERDEAIKPIEEQIKALEDYKDAWSEALHHYERVQNEMYAQTIFGSNWREAALSADANMVNSFVGVYDGLQNQLHNIVEPQIEQKERDIEAIDRQIESYEELKTNQQAYLDFFKNYSKDFSKAVGEQKKALEEFLNLVKQGKDQSGIFRAFDKVMQYFDTDYIPQFANGGTANFTGTAMLHGTANRAELILNNADAKKLYEVIHGSNIPQLTKSVIGNIFDTVKGQGMENISSANTNNNNANNYYTWTVTGNNIRADSYTEFKENMDRFVRQSQMDLDVGKR